MKNIIILFFIIFQDVNSDLKMHLEIMVRVESEKSESHHLKI